MRKMWCVVPILNVSTPTPQLGCCRCGSRNIASLLECIAAHKTVAADSQRTCPSFSNQKQQSILWEKCCNDWDDLSRKWKTLRCPQCWLHKRKSARFQSNRTSHGDCCGLLGRCDLSEDLRSCLLEDNSLAAPVQEHDRFNGFVRTVRIIVWYLIAKDADAELVFPRG